MRLQIVNIVATVKLSSPLDLEKLALVLVGSEMAAGGSKWLKMRLKPENYYTAFYKSGKFLVTGVTSVDEVDAIAQRIMILLKKAGFDVDIEQIKVHNIVLMGSMHLNASLEKIIFALDSAHASYEPEQFPGLMYKGFGASFLLFPSGKFIVTGVRDVMTAEDAAERFRQTIEEVQ